jgi:hypothetical protein
MRRTSIFWGLVLIVLGVIFFLQATGLLTVNVWGLVWPVGLILVGLWIMFGVFYHRKPQLQQVTIPLEGAARADLKVSHGAGKLTISAGAEPGNLLSGDFTGGLDFKAKREEDLLKAKLRVPEQDFPWGLGPDTGLQWSFGLAREIPLRIEINTGASEGNIDLTELKVTDLRLRTGASSTILKLPANAGLTHVDAEGGAASLTIQIPSGVAARIRERSGVASVSVDTGRFPKQGDVFQSPEYETAANKVELEIHMGAGSVDVH